MPTFITKYKNVTLIMEPTYHQVVNGKTQIVYGKEIRFLGGEYKTENEKEIKFLRNHPYMEQQKIFELNRPSSKPKSQKK